jgi:hypothetical protein
MTEKNLSQTHVAWGQALSDLADGRVSPDQARALSAAWKDQPELRRDWHAMHLIGDSLRSAELAREARPAADLLAALRLRLADEPVVLRPRRWQVWLAPLVVAASFVLVAFAVPGLQSMVLRSSADRMALQSPANWPMTQPTGSTLVSAQPTFAQSVAAPAVRAVLLLPTGSADAVAPFDLAVPAPTESHASSTLMTSASAPR